MPGEDWQRMVLYLIAAGLIGGLIAVLGTML